MSCKNTIEISSIYWNVLLWIFFNQFFIPPRRAETITLENFVPAKRDTGCTKEGSRPAWIKRFACNHHHHHCIFVFLEDITQSTVFIQAFLSSQIFSRLSRSFSWSPDRLMLEYLEMSFRIRLSHVVFGLPFLVLHVIAGCNLWRVPGSRQSGTEFHLS